MELCKNGAIREDYEVIRRSDGRRMAIIFKTSGEAAITAYLTTRGHDRHDGERGKYIAHPLAPQCEREEFRRRAMELRRAGFTGVIRSRDLPPLRRPAPPRQPTPPTPPAPPRQLDLELD